MSRLKEVYDTAVVAFDNAESKNKAAKEEFDVAVAWNAYLTREQTLSQDNEVLENGTRESEDANKKQSKTSKNRKN